MFGVFLGEGAVQSGNSKYDIPAICVAILEHFMSSKDIDTVRDNVANTSGILRSTAGTADNVSHTFLLLLQELAALDVRVQSSSHGWLRQFVSRRLLPRDQSRAILRYCYILTPELLWGPRRTTDSTLLLADLSDIEEFICKDIAFLQPWDAALATHIVQGLCSGCLLYTSPSPRDS